MILCVNFTPLFVPCVRVCNVHLCILKLIWSENYCIKLFIESITHTRFAPLLYHYYRPFHSIFFFSCVVFTALFSFWYLSALSVYFFFFSFCRTHLFCFVISQLNRNRPRCPVYLFGFWVKHFDGGVKKREEEKRNESNLQSQPLKMLYKSWTIFYIRLKYIQKTKERKVKKTTRICASW